MDVAFLTLSTSSPLPDSPVEYDSIATYGSIPNILAVSTELTAMSETYRKRINEELGKNVVRVMRFTVSRKVAEEFRLRRTELDDEEFYFQDVVDSVSLSKTERDQVVASTECIPDEKLREAAVRATVADLEWKKGLAARNARETAREGS